MLERTMSPSPFQQPFGGFADWSFPTNTPTCPIADLSQRFGTRCTLEQRAIPRNSHTPSPRQQSPHSLPRIRTTSVVPPPSQLPSSTLCESSQQPSPLSTTTFPDCSAATIRRQRQRALRDQCSSTHLEAISALVARMVDNREQCDVTDSSAGSTGSTIDEEELALSPISPESPLARCRSDSQTTFASFDRRTSVATSIASSTGRRSTDHRVRKSTRPRSGAASMGKTVLKEESTMEHMRESWLI